MKENISVFKEFLHISLKAPVEGIGKGDGQIIYF